MGVLGAGVGGIGGQEEYGVSSSSGEREGKASEEGTGAGTGGLGGDSHTWTHLDVSVHTWMCRFPSCPRLGAPTPTA